MAKFKVFVTKSSVGRRLRWTPKTGQDGSLTQIKDLGFTCLLTSAHGIFPAWQRVHADLTRQG